MYWIIPNMMPQASDLDTTRQMATWSAQLHDAIVRRQSEIVRARLLDAFPPGPGSHRSPLLDPRPGDTKPPLYYACMYADTTNLHGTLIARMIVGRMTDDQLRQRDGGGSGLHSLHYAVTSGLLDVAEQIVKRCPDLVGQVGGGYNQTPLHYAADRSEWEILDLLWAQASPAAQRLQNDRHETAGNIAVRKFHGQEASDELRERTWQAYCLARLPEAARRSGLHPERKALIQAQAAWFAQFRTERERRAWERRRDADGPQRTELPRCLRVIFRRDLGRYARLLIPLAPLPDGEGGDDLIYIPRYGDDPDSDDEDESDADDADDGDDAEAQALADSLLESGMAAPDVPAVDMGVAPCNVPTVRRRRRGRRGRGRRGRGGRRVSG